MQAKFPVRKDLRLENYNYSQPGYYFLTICTQVRFENILCELLPVGGGLRAAPWLPGAAALKHEAGQSPPLTRPGAAALKHGAGQSPPPTRPYCEQPIVKLTALGRCVQDSIDQIHRLNPGVDVDIYTVMPDHVHMILRLTGRLGGRPLPAIVGRFKSYTDHCYRMLDCPYGPYFWQEGYHDHIVRNDADLRSIREYIQNNPLRWIQDKD